jgi:hypothetical protein
MVNELKKELMSPIAEELEKIKDEDLVKKIPSGTPPKVIETSKIIKKSLIEDFKGSDQTLTKTKATIKQAKEDGANAFYRMIDASEINTKMGEIFEKAKAKALKSIPGGAVMGKLFSLDKLGKAITLVYDKTKDPPKKLIFHVISKIVKKDFEENAKDLLEQAGGTAAAAGQAALEAANKAPKTTETAKTETPKEEPKKEETKTPCPTCPPCPAKPGSFGKRKKGPSASLKKLCKKHGVRLMVKRGKKRVYKSSKVLKEQCKNKLKKNKKKINFGKKKIKRSSIMPKAKRSYGRRRRGRKRSRRSTSSSALARAKAFARKYRKPLIGAGAVGGAYALGKGYQHFAPHGYKLQNPFKYSDESKLVINPFSGRAGLWKKLDEKDDKGNDKYIFRPYISGDIDTGKLQSPGTWGGYLPGTRSIFAPKPVEVEEGGYGKRRRRRRKKRSFGKKSKKPSAALRKLCKRLKVKTTLKRGKKRVYKSESMLKKQCRKAKKRKAKKSKK